MKRQTRFMPEEFDALARYNTEVARGIVHTNDWKEQMQALQVKFEEWLATRARPEERRNYA